MEGLAGRRWLLALGLMVLGLLGNVGGEGVLGGIAYDAETGEYACAVLSCGRSTRVSRYCGILPGVGVVLSIGDTTSRCITDNQCVGRDEMLKSLAASDARQSEENAALVAVAQGSEKCVDSGFQDRSNAAVARSRSGPDFRGRFVGSNVASVNVTRGAESRNETLTFAIMGVEASDPGTTFFPMDYLQNTAGMNATVDLATRLTNALFTGVESNSVLTPCPNATNIFSMAVILGNRNDVVLVNAQTANQTDLKTVMLSFTDSCLNFNGNCITDNVIYGSSDTLNYSTDENCSNKCFPANSMVQLEDKSLKRMGDLQIGDRVLTKNGEYSDIFAFTHNEKTGSFEFVRIETQSGHTVSLSPGHYLYADGVLVTASSLTIGAKVELADGEMDVVVGVHRSKEEGLINPQTIHGDIVVNGIRCSTFTVHVAPVLARILLLPLQIIYRLFGVGVDVAKPSTRFVSLLPNGRSSY